MAYHARIETTGTGSSMNIDLTFPYLDQADVIVTEDGVSKSYTWNTSTQINLATTTSGSEIVVERDTNDDTREVDWTAPGRVTEALMDTSDLQWFYLLQELRDEATWLQGDYLTDVTANVGYAEEWANKAEDSLVSAAAGGDEVDDYSALHHAAKAAASASAASTSESNAATSESNAATSESNAATSETNADLERQYAAEWANKAEDSLVSAAAGGDEVDDYSALHWANKAAATAAAIGDLDSLSDVTITTPADNELLAYNSGTGEWTNQPAFPADALEWATSSIAIGDSSAANGTGTPSGTDCTVFGYLAAQDLTSGTDLVAIGSESLKNATTTDNIVAVGYKSGVLITTGSTESVLIGNWAGRSMVNALQTTLVGHRAGDSLASGSYNTFMGYYAGATNSSGEDNVAIGRQAFRNGAASKNTFVGRHAGYSVDGDRNVAIGYDAMGEITGAGASNNISNVCVGSDAGKAMVGAQENTIVGQAAGSTLTTGDHNILIGRACRTDTGTDSNVIRIGDQAVHTSAAYPIDIVMNGVASDEHSYNFYGEIDVTGTIRVNNDTVATVADATALALALG